MKAIGYLRVSTHEQADRGVSLETQLHKLRAYCSLNGLELVSVHTDSGVSGSIPLHRRPAGSELISRVEKGTAIVALKLDRLFRSTVDALEAVEQWDKTGASLHLIDNGGQSLNTGSAIGRFFLTQLAAFAELERNMIAERTAAALSYKKSTGAVYGRTPYGFTRSGNRLEEAPQEQAAISQIVELREQGNSYRAIAAALNEQGIKSKRGGQWYASTVSYLLNTTLAGMPNATAA